MSVARPSCDGFRPFSPHVANTVPTLVDNGLSLPISAPPTQPAMLAAGVLAFVERAGGWWSG